MKYYVAYIENGKSFKDNYIHTIILEYPKEIKLLDSLTRTSSK